MAEAHRLETDVLVVGSGPAGASASLFLATYGTRVIMITRYGRLSQTPRAHVTNQRTLEALRDVGVEDEVIRAATPWDLIGTMTWSTSLAGEELGRLQALGTGTANRAEYELASPSPMLDCPQSILEPILVTAAQRRGATVRFDTEYVSHTQDASGVDVTVRDRLTDQELTVRARYLIGADGARSMVARDLDLDIKGLGVLGGALNLVIEADLTHLVAHRPSNLYFMVQPGGSERQGVGVEFLRMVKPWTQWLMTVGYDVEAGPPELTEEFVRQTAVRLVGTDDFDLKILSASPWTVNHGYATTLSSGRVFCVGDAVHRHSPNNGLGSNTSIQDSYNLAWKLHLVVQGLASPTLLESYTAERAPVARQVVERATTSISDLGTILAALGVDDSTDAEMLNKQLALRKTPGPQGEDIRRALREAFAFQAYQFSAHGVELNQRYTSRAVVTDGSPVPEYRQDPELFAQASSRPGAKLPHTWVTRHHRSVSTLDLGGRGTFSVWTGVGGLAWAQAAKAVTARTGLPLTVVDVGPGLSAEDPYGTWAQLREVEDTGVLLVRPDLYVAARLDRLPGSPDDAERWLSGALEAVLGATART